VESKTRGDLFEGVGKMVQRDAVRNVDRALDPLFDELVGVVLDDPDRSAVFGQTVVLSERLDRRIRAETVDFANRPGCSSCVPNRDRSRSGNASPCESFQPLLSSCTPVVEIAMTPGVRCVLTVRIEQKPEGDCGEREGEQSPRDLRERDQTVTPSFASSRSRSSTSATQPGQT
jgi:hypothetical protein